MYNLTVRNEKQFSLSTSTASQNVKALREAMRLNQDEFGKRFGYKNQKAISAFETGTNKVSYALAVKLGLHFGFSPELIYKLKFKITDGTITNLPPPTNAIEALRKRLQSAIDLYMDNSKTFTQTLQQLAADLSKIAPNKTTNRKK